MPVDLNRPQVVRKLAYAIWLMRLPAEKMRLVLARLKYPVSQARDFFAASRLWRELASLKNQKPSAVFARLEDIPPLAIVVNCLASTDESICKILKSYLTRWRTITPSITGHDLQARGLPPGPAYRHILGSLRDAWLDGMVQSQDEEQQLLEKLIQQEEQQI